MKYCEGIPETHCKAFQRDAKAASAEGCFNKKQRAIA